MTKHEPTHDEIAVRAYELFLDRGGLPGHHEEDLAPRRNRAPRALAAAARSADGAASHEETFSRRCRAKPAVRLSRGTFPLPRESTGSHYLDAT